MKNLLYSFYVVFILLACHKSDTSVDPADLLYRRWQSVSSGEYITFHSDGIILYGVDGTEGPCCQPRFFIRQATILNFKDATYKPLPAAVHTNGCSFVRCAGPGNSWIIVSLTTEVLILQTPYGRQTYKAN